MKHVPGLPHHGFGFHPFPAGMRLHIPREQGNTRPSILPPRAVHLFNCPVMTIFIPAFHASCFLLIKGGFVERRKEFFCHGSGSFPFPLRA